MARAGDCMVPFVLEVAFGVSTEDGAYRAVVSGLNWSPTLTVPSPAIREALSRALVQDYDPTVCVVHLACPHLEFKDRGKSHLALPSEIEEALTDCIRLTTKKWTQRRNRADRTERMRQRELDELRKAHRRDAWTIKEAAFHVMKKAYLKASAGGTLPANARQIMYAARPQVIELTGGACWKDSAYFTQTLLPQYLEMYPEKTADWDVVYDARGQIREPHTDLETPLGTLAVRRYLSGWLNGQEPVYGEASVSTRALTRGPSCRYSAVLFIEKEGFNPILEHARLAEKYDLAIMSTKGQSVTAARRLVEELTRKGVRIFVVRDFDKAGFEIVNNLRSDTARYQYTTAPDVIDLGLRLDDVKAMDLESEEVYYSSKKDPQMNLLACDATEEECKFLCSHGRPGQWQGRRVELNAMTSDQFIDWLKRKLDANGIGKVVPDEEVLREAYRRAILLATIQKRIDELLDDDEGPVEVPGDLPALVAEHLEGTTKSWDEVIWDLANRSTIK